MKNDILMVQSLKGRLMYLNDELIILGLIFINVVIIFYIYKSLKNKYKSQIKELQKQIVSLNKKESTTIKEDKYADTKKSFVVEQIKKMEALEKELAKQKKRVYDIKIIAKEASDIKSKFLSNVKTELRTPINEIIINAGILKKELQDTQKADYAQNIFKVGNQLFELVNKIIRSTNMQNNSFKIEEHAMDIVKLISDIIGEEKNDAVKKGLQLSMEVGQNVPHSLIIDAKKVKEIVKNLVQNAIKFTYDGYVKVIISADEANLLKNSLNLSINVHDSGIGVEPANQKKIFEAFGNENMALGLSINKKIAQLMHGDMMYDNNIPKGSVFTLYLPNIEIALNDSTLTCKDDINVDFSLIRPSDANIMVIDNDNSTKNIVQKSFHNTAVRIYAYESAREAIETLKESPFDMILIDIDILCSEHSAISKVIASLSDAPIVTLVTTRVKDKDLNSVKADIAGHLKKPICEAELFKISLQILNSLK